MHNELGRALPRTCARRQHGGYSVVAGPLKFCDSGFISGTDRNCEDAMIEYRHFRFTNAAILGCAAAFSFGLIMNSARAAEPAVSSAGAVVVLTEVSGSPLDFINAKTIDLPIAPSYSPERAQIDVIRTLSAAAATAHGTPTSSTTKSGGAGTGQRPLVPVNLGEPAKPVPKRTASPADFGMANLPFSTARADLDPTATNDQYPYRAAGKLFFLIAGSTYICSASNGGDASGDDLDCDCASVSGTQPKQSRKTTSFQ
jgi:hypothetical protein